MPKTNYTRPKPRGAKPPATPNFAKVFETFGVEFRVNASSAEAVADECPWCHRDRFYLNVTTGQYHCKHCQQKGNVTTYLTWLHGEALAATTPANYAALGRARGGVAPQTLRRHELAYDGRRWLVPFKSSEGGVVNLQLYEPGRPKPNKFNLPGLPTCLYGFDKLTAAAGDRTVFLCEGPWDAIALDYAVGPKHRDRYVFVAAPGAFKETWVEHFRGHKVRALYDNDEAGRRQSERTQKLLGGVADELLVLKWPDGTLDGYDVNDFVRENPGVSPVGFLAQHCYKVVPVPRLAWVHGWERNSSAPEAIDWVWPDRLRCGSYCSLSGPQGTLKSTLTRELVARFTSGRPLPGCGRVGLPAGHVIYVTAEDSVATVLADLGRGGANLNLVSVLRATLKDGDPLNVLAELPELREAIRRYGVRFVVIDGQNSVVGAPCIATDMLARHHVTNPLHQFAQRENVCLLGIRNEDQDGRAYGPASMGHLARCVLRTEKVGELGGERYYKLVFVKVSDAAPRTHPDIPFSVRDLGGPAREILWDVAMPAKEDYAPLPPEEAEAVRAALKASRHDAAKPPRAASRKGAKG